MFHIFRRALRAPYFNISEISWCLLSESVPLWNLHFIWKGWQIPDTFLFSLWEFSMRKQHAQIFHNIYLIQWLILEIEKWQDIFPSHWCNYFPLCHWFSVERCFFMNKITVKKGSFCHYYLCFYGFNVTRKGPLRHCTHQIWLKKLSMAPQEI